MELALFFLFLFFSRRLTVTFYSFFFCKWTLNLCGCAVHRLCSASTLSLNEINAQSLRTQLGQHGFFSLIFRTCVKYFVVIWFEFSCCCCFFLFSFRLKVENGKELGTCAWSSSSSSIDGRKRKMNKCVLDEKNPIYLSMKLKEWETTERLLCSFSSAASTLTADRGK